LLALSGFLPVGHDRTHWVVFHEAFDILLHPDPDLPFDWRRSIFYGSEVLGLSYPLVAGFLFAASAGLRHSRAVAAVTFTLHLFVALCLTGAAMALALPKGGEAESDFRANTGLLGAAVLLGALSGVESLLFFRGVEGLRPDRVNLPPAVFLLGVNVTLYFVLFKNPVWPATAYWVGSAGSAFVVAGIVLRREKDRAIER
jgi:drug/metabolite transporter (DMT)-like permease